MDLKTIILDFDGTIVESVGIKDAVFVDLFKDYPAQLEEIMHYHKGRNAVIRFEKFRHIYEVILRKEYSPAIENELSRRFSELVYSRIVSCPYVKGAEEFLDFFMGEMPLYLVSVNPPDELDRVLQSRGLHKYFKKVYAFPWVKTDAINDILHGEGIFREEAVFIGDTWEDYISASEAGVTFIGRFSGRPFQDAPIHVFKDLSEIKHFLSSSEM